MRRRSEVEARLIILFSIAYGAFLSAAISTYIVPFPKIGCLFFSFLLLYLIDWGGIIVPSMKIYSPKKRYIFYFVQLPGTIALGLTFVLCGNLPKNFDSIYSHLVIITMIFYLLSTFLWNLLFIIFAFNLFFAIGVLVSLIFGILFWQLPKAFEGLIYAMTLVKVFINIINFSLTPALRIIKTHLKHLKRI